MPKIRFLDSGEALISPASDPEELVDSLLAMNYQPEFVLSLSFQPNFIAALMEAGFLVMAAPLSPESDAEGQSKTPLSLLIAKLHLERAVLDFKQLHISRTVRRLMPRYSLVVDADFDRLLEGCVAAHGVNWLLPELRAVFRAIRTQSLKAPLDRGFGLMTAKPMVKMLGFGLFRDEKLVAGEFGVALGGVYTSYSGFRVEDSAGTVQMVLTADALCEAGFAFWDLGMPLAYKTALGALTLQREAFIKRFRSARSLKPKLTI